jgi:hypothetical protein
MPETISLALSSTIVVRKNNLLLLFKLLAALIGLFLVVARTFAESANVHPVVEVYPGPKGIASSSLYTVQILQGAHAYDSFVYQIQNPAFLPSGQPSGITT